VSRYSGSCNLREVHWANHGEQCSTAIGGSDGGRAIFEAGWAGLARLLWACEGASEMDGEPPAVGPQT